MVLVFGPRAVKVVIVRELSDSDGYRVALITTDLKASAAQTITRYADRWSIEVCFQDAKHVVGVGEARNRVKRAVERTVPFGLLCQSVAVAWYALHGDPAADVRRRRLSAPWYPTKRDPSMLDVLTSLRRELIRAEYHAGAGRTRIAAKIRRPALHNCLSALLDRYLAPHPSACSAACSESASSSLMSARRRRLLSNQGR